METNKSRAAKKRGPNWKADCTICGKPISNRMVYDDIKGDVFNPTPVKYAHYSCSKKVKAEGKWYPAW